MCGLPDFPVRCRPPCPRYRANQIRYSIRGFGSRTQRPVPPEPCPSCPNPSGCAYTWTNRCNGSGSRCQASCPCGRGLRSSFRHRRDPAPLAFRKAHAYHAPWLLWQPARADSGAGRCVQHRFPGYPIPCDTLSPCVGCRRFLRRLRHALGEYHRRQHTRRSRHFSRP